MQQRHAKSGELFCSIAICVFLLNHIGVAQGEDVSNLLAYKKQIFLPNTKPTCVAISRARITRPPPVCDARAPDILFDVCPKVTPFDAWLPLRAAPYFVQPNQCNAFNKTKLPLLDDDDEDVVSKVVTDPIATFDEWTQQHLAQRTQSNTQNTINIEQKEPSKIEQPSTGTAKNGDAADRPGTPAPVETAPNLIENAAQIVALQARRNYASKECGAKIVNKNADAEHANALLNEKERDDYLRNPCEVTGKFVIIELCESVQPLYLELANFELFSSSPSEIRVSLSERYPTSEWAILTTLNLENTRHIQTFEVKQRQYAKFLRLELLAHHGNEHYCTLSMVRLLGISMVDEYEAHEMAAKKQQMPDEQILHMPDVAAPSSTTIQPPISNSSNKTNDTLPLRQPSPPGKNSMVDLVIHLKDAVNTAKDVLNRAANMVGLGTPGLPPQTIQQMYETCASENHPKNARCIAINSTLHGNWTSTSSANMYNRCFQCPVKMLHMRSTRRFCDFIFGGPTTDLRRFNRIYTSKTNMANVTLKRRNEQVRLAQTRPQKKFLRRVLLTEYQKKNPQHPIPAPKVIHVPPSNLRPPVQAPSTSKPQSEAPIRQPVESDDSVLLPASSQGSRESIFIRLTNRIKQLELNMSLSSMYLSELSKKYRSHMDDIQRQYNRTVRHLNDTNRRLTELNTQLEERIQGLAHQVDDQNASIENLKAAQDFDSIEELYWYIIGASLAQLFLTLTIVRVCCWSRRLNREDVENIYNQMQQRNQTTLMVHEAVATESPLMGQSLNSELEFCIDRLREPQRDEDVDDDRPSVKSTNTLDECSSTESSMQQNMTLSSRSIPNSVNEDEKSASVSVPRSLDTTPHKITSSPPWMLAHNKQSRRSHHHNKKNESRHLLDVNRFSALAGQGPTTP